jgi:hypothetical protein
MQKRMIFNPQAAAQLKNFIKGTIPIFEKAMSFYPDNEDVMVGSRRLIIFSPSSWTKKTFQSRIRNLLLDAAYKSREGRPIDQVINIIEEVEDKSINVFRRREFFYFRKRITGIKNIYTRILREELERARAEELAKLREQQQGRRAA